jgi:hypothetical protein
MGISDEAVAMGQSDQNKAAGATTKPQALLQNNQQKPRSKLKGGRNL